MSSETPTEHNPEHCSFCGASSDRARALVAGPNRVYICDLCVDLCKQTIRDAQCGSWAAEDPSSRPQDVAVWLSLVRGRLLDMLERQLNLAQELPAPSTERLEVNVAKKLLDDVTSSLREGNRILTLLVDPGAPRTRLSAPRSTPRRRGPAGIAITDVFVATRAIATLLREPPLVLGLPSAPVRGLLPSVVKNLAQELKVDLTDAVTESSGSSQDPGPWISTINDNLLNSLSDIDSDNCDQLVDGWLRHPETGHLGWTREDATWVLRQVVSLARRAVRERTELHIWIDP